MESFYVNHYNDYIDVILDYLNSESPFNYTWFFDGVSFNVNILLKDVDEYISFIEDLVKCNCTYDRNIIDGVDFISIRFAFSTLLEHMPSSLNEYLKKRI